MIPREFKSKWLFLCLAYYSMDPMGYLTIPPCCVLLWPFTVWILCVYSMFSSCCLPANPFAKPLKRSLRILLESMQLSIATIRWENSEQQREQAEQGEHGRRTLNNIKRKSIPGPKDRFWAISLRRFLRHFLSDSRLSYKLASYDLAYESYELESLMSQMS